MHSWIEYNIPKRRFQHPYISRYDQAKAIQPRNWLHELTNTNCPFLNKESYLLKKIRKDIPKKKGKTKKT